MTKFFNKNEQQYSVYILKLEISINYKLFFES